MRDYVDARLSLGEFLLPSVVVILAHHPARLVLPERRDPDHPADVRVHPGGVRGRLPDVAGLQAGAGRSGCPKAPTKGLLMYGMNRSTQIRRFRMPPPRIKRGDAY